MSGKLEKMVLACIAATFIFGQTLFAADLSYELRAGMTYSDNVTRVSADEVDQTIGTAGIRLNLGGESRRIQGNLFVDADYQHFLDDAYDNDWLSQVKGELLLKPIPELFHWVTDGRFGQTRTNPFAASTPDNREDVGRFSTGPDLLLKLGGRTNLELGSRYSGTFFERSATDSDEITGSFSLTRALSSSRRISLNGSGGRVEYDAEFGLGDFERYSAYLGLDSEISKGTLSAQIGANEVHFDGESFQGTLAGLSWTRQLSAVSSVSISLNQSISDAGDYFSRLESIFLTGSSESSIIPIREPFETIGMSTSYRYSRGRLMLSVGATVSEDDYLSSSDLDSRRLRGSLTGNIDMSSGWSSEFQLSYEDRDFQAANRTDDYLRASAKLSRELGGGFSLGFDYRLEDRHSTISGDDYAENRYSLVLSYSPDR